MVEPLGSLGARKWPRTGRQTVAGPIQSTSDGLLQALARTVELIHFKRRPERPVRSNRQRRRTQPDFRFQIGRGQLLEAD